ncbi:hypothetical protein V6N13_042808 [Hibiscus sabdariffa]
MIETSKLEKVEETVEVIVGDWSGRIQVQEVEVVYSHDLICQCANNSVDDLSEAGSEDLPALPVIRDNPLYVGSMVVEARVQEYADGGVDCSSYNKAGVEVVFSKGVSQKVRSVNELVLKVGGTTMRY